MMKKYLLSILVLLVTSLLSVAQNPISPPGVNIADTSAHVWADDKLYINGSNDESSTYFCLWTHHDLNKIEIRLKPGKKAGKIQLVMDQTRHSSFATIDVAESTKPDEWVTVQASVKPSLEVHGLWLNFLRRS